MSKVVTTVVGGVVMVALIGAVLLAEINGSATSIVLFATTVLAAIPGVIGLSKATEVAERTKDVAGNLDAVSEDLGTVKTQTNGALPAAVHEAILAALADRPLPPEIQRNAAASNWTPPPTEPPR